MSDTKVCQWTEISFSFGGWIECTCGFRPNSQEEMDFHARTIAVVTNV